MPVVTRSQSKKNSLKPIEKPLVKPVENPDKIKYFKIKDSFISKVKKSLADCESAVGKANKIRECKNVMKYNKIHENIRTYKKNVIIYYIFNIKFVRFDYFL